MATPGSAHAPPVRRLAAEGSAAGGKPEGASSDDPNHPSQWIFQNERIIGNGSFGVVYQAIVKQNQKARAGSPRRAPAAPFVPQLHPCDGQLVSCSLCSRRPVCLALA